MENLLHTIRVVSLLAVSSITYIGAFSRITSGRYTPRFYAYQVDRAPNDASTRLIPVVDLSLGTLTVLPATRPYGLLGCFVLYSVGIILRLKEGKNATGDIALGALGGLAWWSEVAGW